MAGDVGIDFGRADVGMAQEFLDDAQIRAVFEQVGGKAVAEHVGSDVSGDPSMTRTFFNAQPKCDRRKGSAALAKKNVRRSAFGEEFFVFGVAIERAQGRDLQIDAFGAELALAFWIAIEKGPFALVLQEPGKMIELDVAPLRELLLLRPTHETPQKRGVGLLCVFR